MIENQTNEKNKLDKTYLYNRQKETMDILLKNGAISKAQYDYSLGCLKKKMNIIDK